MDEQTGQALPNPEESQQVQTSADPVDIAQAFQLVRDFDKKAAGDAEPEGQPAAAVEPPAGQQQQGQPEPEPQYAAPPVQDTASYGVPAGQVPAGGSADYQPQNAGFAIPTQKDIDKSIAEMAVESARRIFEENQIKKMTDADLYVQHEDGTVEWRNPDNPNKPFDRMEAGKYVDFFNDRIDKAWRQLVTDEFKRLKNENKHRYDVVGFAPLYNKMSQAERAVFDDIISSNAITDGQGNIVGFNCDLMTAAQQAVKIANRFQPKQQPKQQQQQQPQQQQQQPAGQPPMDIKTGAGSSPTNEEPKNIEEAMAMIQAQKKEAKNG